MLLHPSIIILYGWCGIQFGGLHASFMHEETVFVSVLQMYNWWDQPLKKKKGTECVKSSVDSAIQHSNCRKHCKTLASRETLNSKLELKVNIGQKEILSNRLRKPLKIKQDRGMKRNSFALDLWGIWLTIQSKNSLISSYGGKWKDIFLGKTN